MKQILNIFRKDCRHFWPEILLSLAITAAFTSLLPCQWSANYGDKPTGALGLDLSRLQLLSYVMAVLMPVGWFLLIARVIHDESLLGTKQFWVTRPYIWYKLAAEKLVFLAVFVLLPYLASQAFLLHRAGFPPQRYIHGLLFNLMLVAGAFVLPMLCLAVVTSTLLRMIGTLLALAVVLGIVAFFCPSGSFDFMPPAFIPWPSSERILTTVILIFSIAILCAQYASRGLGLARTLLALLPVVLVAVTLGALNQKLLIHFYPSLLPDQDSPIHVVLDQALITTRESRMGGSRYVHISLPLKTSNLPSDQVFQPDDVRLTIHLPDGSHWTSAWQKASTERFDAHKTDASVAVYLDRSTYERIRAEPVTLQVELAFTQLEADAPERVPFQWDKKLSLPGIGLCSVTADQRPNYLSCREPMRTPATTTISIPQAQSACAPGEALQSADTASAWWGTDNPDPAELTFDPVQTQGNVIGTNSNPGFPHTYCLQTTLVLTPYHVVRRFRYKFVTQALSLPQVTSSEYVIY